MSGMAAIAMGMHSSMMALEPLIMVPKKNIRANTMGRGMGRPPKNTGSSWMILTRGQQRAGHITPEDTNKAY